jgi:hypothetical protein
MVYSLESIPLPETISAAAHLPNWIFVIVMNIARELMRFLSFGMADFRRATKFRAIFCGSQHFFRVAVKF